MKYLEVRRHGKRHAPNDHLAQEGVTHARLIGENMGPFARVLTSTLPRAFETAIAMGFAVDLSVEWLCADPYESYEVSLEIPEPLTFAACAEAARDGAFLAAFCREQAQHWHSVVRQIPDGSTALMISHGGLIEMGTVGCLLDPGVNYDEWGDFALLGDAVSYCEGVRLTFHNSWPERLIGCRVLRVPPPPAS